MSCGPSGPPPWTSTAPGSSATRPWSALQPVYVDQPDVKTAIEILKGIKSRYEEHHNLTITDARSRARDPLRALHLRSLPPGQGHRRDGQGAAKVRLRRYATNPEAARAAHQAPARGRGQGRPGAGLRDDEAAPGAPAAGEDQDAGLSQDGDSPAEVRVQDVAEVVAKWTGVPVTNIYTEEAEKLLQLEARLHQRVVGQDEAVAAVADAIRRSAPA